MTHISFDWTYQGFPLARLENRDLRVEILPAFGGKIWTIEHRLLGRQFLWHHPRHRLRPLPLGASYDDHFFGGFDELLPNDISELVDGESLVDHGELWTTPLEVHIEGDGLALTGVLPITPLRYRKLVRLVGPSLTLEYRLENIGRRPLNLLWKLHPALHITPGTQIIVPAETARVADPQWSRVKDRQEFSWSQMEHLHRVPSMDGSTEFLYLLGLTDGKCGLSNVRENWRFQLSFPKEIFTSVWVFASFGGWRDLEMLILEPCTTPRISLAESAAVGQCLQLKPNACVEAAVRVEVGPAVP